MAINSVIPLRNASLLQPYINTHYPTIMEKQSAVLYMNEETTAVKLTPYHFFQQESSLQNNG